MTTATYPQAASRSEGGVLLICSDARLAWCYLLELAGAGGPHRAPLATGLAHAEAMLRGWTPLVIILDESCVEMDSCVATRPGQLEPIVALLTEHAPIVVVASAEQRDALAFLIGAGAVDFVTRHGNFVPVTIRRAMRRTQIAEMASSAAPCEAERSRNFGEMLRHEVNNPLTGILGNAEMLLKLRGELPIPVIARLETIAELAVRLRETIRRLSDCWEEQRDSARVV